jgi:hypothetical protein
VVGALLEVVVEHEGRALTATRGSSRLHGHVEGMFPRSADRIEGAIVDAFERSVLRPAFVDATNAALVAERGREPDAPAGPTRVDETRDSWQIRDHESSAAAHVLSAVFDGGDTFSFGARYLHDHFSSGLGLLWGGYGVEARIISDDFTRVDAVAGLGILRAGIGYEQVFSLEFGMGPGRSDEVRAVGIAGAYFTAYYVDLGFTAQFVVSPTPQFRPLTGGHFGVRINVPVDVHGVTVGCHSPLPCRAEGPAFVGNEKGPRRPTELESKD